MKITSVAPRSIAEEVGIRQGDELLEIDGHRVLDAIDFRFREGGEKVRLKIARHGEITVYDIEKDEEERVGIDVEEMKILSCGNDCMFCFVDQNPKGLRQQLYVRDGDYRLSFMYGNFTTMTNAGPAILDRIIRQRLSPQYISVHVTDYAARKKLMGLRKDDHILEKMKLLHDNGIDMHTQIVLCPGLNDGELLRKTVSDLYTFNGRIISLAIVPVGLTDHRFGLHKLSRIDGRYARQLLRTVEQWQDRFRKETGRNFIYPSDEFFILAGGSIPAAKYYDGFPQAENGVGLVRQFLDNFHRQARRFPRQLSPARRVTMVTAELAAGFMRDEILPRLHVVRGLDIVLDEVPNLLYGRSVTVAGLLSGNCVYSALKGKACGDLLLLPPDILNADGLFLDDWTVPKLEEHLGVPIHVFDGSWRNLFTKLRKKGRKQSEETLIRSEQFDQ